jgi:hypothetical protein
LFCRGAFSNASKQTKAGRDRQHDRPGQAAPVAPFPLKLLQDDTVFPCVYFVGPELLSLLCETAETGVFGSNLLQFVRFFSCLLMVLTRGVMAVLNNTSSEYSGSQVVDSGIDFRLFGKRKKLALDGGHTKVDRMRAI